MILNAIADFNNRVAKKPKGTNLKSFIHNTGLEINMALYLVRAMKRENVWNEKTVSKTSYGYGKRLILVLICITYTEWQRKPYKPPLELITSFCFSDMNN